ncbi:protein of unknown function DUF4378 [Dillenia turbinata]|uniref:DUF4378 domain-containing protein n=1 Tax=Dillenia turbinata TaxID=194707 RepID=A0AAN8ZMJ4_9MAGN
MGKHFGRKHMREKKDDKPLGCLYTVLQVLDHHHWHWHNVRKSLPHKRHGHGTHVTGTKGNGQNVTDTQEHKVAGKDDSMNVRPGKHDSSVESYEMRGKKLEGSLKSKTSKRDRIRSLLAAEMFREIGKHRRHASAPTMLKLKRTYSLHHVKLSGHDLFPEINPNKGRPGTIQGSIINSSSASTSEPQPIASDEAVVIAEKDEVCATTSAEDKLEHRQVDEQGKQQNEHHELPQEKEDKAKHDYLGMMATNDELQLQTEDFPDALEMQSIREDLLLKILQSCDLINGQVRVSKGTGLTKSESFPEAGSSSTRDVGQSKRKCKQRICSFPEEGNTWSLDQAARKDEAEEENCRQLVPFTSETELQGPPVVSRDGDIRVKLGVSHRAIKHFKNLRQKIKHAIKESRKERERIAMDSVLHKVPYGQRISKDMKEEILNQLKRPAPVNRDGINSAGKDGFRHMRRTSSVNDSMERYAQLYESTISSEAKLRKSKGLKSKGEDIGLLVGSVPNSLARIVSLPNFYPPNEELFGSSCPVTPLRGPLSLARMESSNFNEQKTPTHLISLEHDANLDHLVKRGSQVGQSLSVGEHQMESELLAIDKDDPRAVIAVDEPNETTTMGSITLQEQELVPMTDTADRLDELHELISFSASEEQWSPNKLLSLAYNLTDCSNKTLKDFVSFRCIETTPEQLLFSSLDGDQQHEPALGSPLLPDGKISEGKKVLSKPDLQFQIDTKDKDDFNYVKDVLELSGFRGEELHDSWHSADQPLDPSVFRELEGCFLPEPDSSGYEVLNWDHLLLFDLINEVLVQMYERSCTYCPMPLTFLCHVSPMPKRHHILEEVWSVIRSHLSLQPELDQMLDSVAIPDFAKNDGWMNLHFDVECLGLEIEDIIFDDLLDELLTF